MRHMDNKRGLGSRRIRLFSPSFWKPSNEPPIVLRKKTNWVIMISEQLVHRSSRTSPSLAEFRATICKTSVDERHPHNTQAMSQFLTACFTESLRTLDPAIDILLVGQWLSDIVVG